jgi:SAM-dependent methyltransferase
VILFGGGNLGKKVQWKCQSCGRTNYTRLPDRMEYLKVLCPCGRDRKVERAQGQAPWPCYLDSDRVTIRILALLIAKASAFIGPDSSGLHLAASFDRPSLGIFFSFDGDLRMRYYRNSRYMQIEVPCGPCFQYGRGPCWKHARDGSPLCVAHVTAGELYGEFTCLLKGQPPPVKAPFQPPEARPCPVCLSVKRKYLGRKGTVCYYECLTCSMIYRSNEVKEPSARVYPLSDISQLRQQERSQLVLAGLLHKRFFCPGAVALEVGCRAPHTLAELKKRGWDVHGLDLEGEAPFGLPGKFPGLEEVITRCTFESFKTDRKFTLIWMNQVFERFHEPLEVFRKVHSLLEDEGIFALHAYDGDQWRVLQFIPRWHGINTSYTGEHSVIPSERSLKLLAALTGFHYLGREPLHDPDCLFIKFQKCNCTVSEGTESTKENRRTDLARIIHETSIEGSKWSRGRGIKGI